MADQATSNDPSVQLQLDRLNAMTAGEDKLGRVRLRRLLARLGNPERHLPPTFHVAGTNGKGSTCTYLRGAIQAEGLSVHVYTSPHLVRLNERIRIANCIVTDSDLATLLSDTLDAVGEDETTFFEATTAAAFLAFARTPADACIVEVGIGGRLDATNVMPKALVCGIAQIGIDHQAFLGETILEIAAEKAGIAKMGVPLVTQVYTREIADTIAAIARRAGSQLFTQGHAWDVRAIDGRLHYHDSMGSLTLPEPVLAGSHQSQNAGLAIAMLRHQDALTIGPEAMNQALTQASWPARLSRLAPGPLTDLLPPGSEFWLDGAHNVAAMAALAEFIGQHAKGRAVDVLFALLDDKDAKGVLGCLVNLDCRFHMVPIPGNRGRPPEVLCATAHDLGFVAEVSAGIAEALTKIGVSSSREEPPFVLIAGSLYLAGEVLRLNREIPD